MAGGGSHNQDESRVGWPGSIAHHSVGRVSRTGPDMSQPINFMMKYCLESVCTHFTFYD